MLLRLLYASLRQRDLGTRFAMEMRMEAKRAELEAERLSRELNDA